MCNQNFSRMYIAPRETYMVVHRAKRARRSGIHIRQRWRTRRQSWRRCNSQEGSEAKRLSVEVACCSNSQRETGGIKLLQTITFNEKVNATNRGLARTWMQMCRRRVISKQSSPPTYRLLFLPPSSSSHPPHCRCLPSSEEDREKQSNPFVKYIIVCV